MSNDTGPSAPFRETIEVAVGPNVGGHAQQAAAAAATTSALADAEARGESITLEEAARASARVVASPEPTPEG